MKQPSFAQPSFAQPSFAQPSFALLPLMACLGLVASPAARADEPNPYYIGAELAGTHDSNIFRAQDDAAHPRQADTITTASLLAGFDQPISRQRLYLDGKFSHNNYKNRSDLNNNSYSLLTGIDWATVANLSGKLSAALNRNLAQYGSPDAPGLTKLNLETSRQFAATAQLGGVTKLTFEGGLTHRSVDYSAPEWAFREYRQNAGNLGVKYAPSDLLTLGVGLRETRGEYPDANNFPFAAVGGPVAEHYRRHDIDLTATWVASGASTFDARLSGSRQTYDTASARDFSGASGSVQWRWRPTGKLNFYTLLLRDTGSEAGFFSYLDISPQGIQLLQQAGDTSRLTTLGRIVANYEATAKIRLMATASQTHRTLVNTLLLTPETGSDDTVQGSLGVRYAPTRNIQLGCDWSRERRSVSLPPGSALSYPYKDAIYSCMGQIVLK